jgi:hypothetical protein
VETRHEVIESIYVRDPNGYFVEFTRKLRPLDDTDATDAALTLQAAIAAEQDAADAGRRVTHIDEIWAHKAALVGSFLDTKTHQAAAAVRIFVPVVDEFASIVNDASTRDDCRVAQFPGYTMIEADQPVEFRRKTLGLKPAVWYGLFTGGLQGTIETFDRDVVRIIPAAA